MVWSVASLVARLLLCVCVCGGTVGESVSCCMGLCVVCCSVQCMRGHRHMGVGLDGREFDGERQDGSIVFVPT